GVAPRPPGLRGGAHDLRAREAHRVDAEVLAEVSVVAHRELLGRAVEEGRGAGHVAAPAFAVAVGAAVAALGVLGADAGEVGLLRAGGVGGDAVEVEPAPGREHGGGELRLRVRPPEVGTLVGDSLEPPGADLAAGEARPEDLEAHGEGAAGLLAHADV